MKHGVPFARVGIWTPQRGLRVRMTRNLELNKIMAKDDPTEHELLRLGEVLFVLNKKALRSALDSLGVWSPLTSIFSFVCQ